MLRLLFVAVPFAIVYWLGLQLGFKTLVAAGIAIVTGALIGVSLSVLFLTNPRQQAAQSIVDWRNRDRTADDIAEDAEIAEGEAAADATIAEGVTATPAEAVAAADPVEASAENGATEAK